ncbi:cytochrome c biogenesis CcdA family protein [Pelagibacterium xiamenense]|uniref:cytochrome c biogenesis CcdA family protein n=1 Tax=Pelagibacterium xiamenense TaxID=2901140 RepID=UPI001E5F8F3D|nr:cytochrome c biogenesis CcdA family protein [Pelagibacterium xiamenense]MCD7060559.1 cytochrome c biogenesis CcdA family protein [Pelagibacterium xiamenense]
MIDLIFAYAAGLLTLLNPCVLPLLPIVLAGSVGQHRLGPVALAGGLAVSFTLAGFFGYAFAQALGLFPEDIARIGAVLMIAFGAVLLVPQASAGFARLAGGVASGGNRALSVFEGTPGSGGLWRQGISGALLGVVWSPCIGPTLGGAIALASAGENLFYAFAIMAVFSLGAGTIVLALAYGSRELIARRRERLMAVARYAKPVMGVALIAVGLGIWFGIDKMLEFWALQALPAGLLDLSVSV